MSILAGLGALESSVLDALWRASEPMSVRDVHAKLARKRALAYTTVLTVLDRLHDKGLVTRRRDGKAFLYAPQMSREDWIGARAASVLTDGETQPSRSLAMAFLDSAERASPELVSELESLIAERRRRRQK